MSLFPSALLTAFLVAIASIPSIIGVARRINLLDVPDERKRHRNQVPLLGGLAIFLSTLFSFTLWGAPFVEARDAFMIASILLLFFLGLRDDMLPLDAVAKITGQLVAVLMVVFFSELQLSGLYGLFGVHNLSAEYSVPVTILVILYIINAFNLIDGADGLAAGLGCIASAVLGYLFYEYNEVLMSILAFSLCGALLGFLVFNMAPAKIFMGDSGSMLSGFIIAVLCIRFAELTKMDVDGPIPFQHAPVIVLASLIVPFADTIRIFIIRIFKRRSPFRADRNHIHHKLFELGLSHRQVSLILWGLTIVYLLLAFILLEYLPASWVFYAIAGSALLLTQLPHWLIKWRKKRQIA